MKNLTRPKLIAIIIGVMLAIAGIIFGIAAFTEPDPLDPDRDLYATDTRNFETPAPFEGPTQEPFVPEPGPGIVGDENPEMVTDDDLYTEIYLPFINEPTIYAGSGFILTADSFTSDDVLTSVAYPRGSNADDPKAIELQTVENKGTREVRWNVILPTNVATGAYTMDIAGSSEDYKLDFFVLPPEEQQPK